MVDRKAPNPSPPLRGVQKTPGFLGKPRFSRCMSASEFDIQAIHGVFPLFSRVLAAILEVHDLGVERWSVRPVPLDHGHRGSRRWWRAGAQLARSRPGVRPSWSSCLRHGVRHAVWAYENRGLHTNHDDHDDFSIQNRGDVYTHTPYVRSVPEKHVLSQRLALRIHREPKRPAGWASCSAYALARGALDFPSWSSWSSWNRRFCRAKQGLPRMTGMTTAVMVVMVFMEPAGGGAGQNPLRRATGLSSRSSAAGAG